MRQPIMMRQPDGPKAVTAGEKAGKPLEEPKAIAAIAVLPLENVGGDPRRNT